jgi:hypothetical protein
MNPRMREPWPGTLLYGPSTDPATRIIRRGEDLQLRVEVVSGAEGLGLALYRKSPAEPNDFESFIRTAAGFTISFEQVPELIEALHSLLVWRTTR